MTTEEVIEILRDRGIELSVGGCGCCGSPWITINIDGEEVLNTENHGLDSWAYGREQEGA